MRQLGLATSWGELRLAGGSRAGEASLVLLPQLRLALDAGRPARALVPLQHVVVSHGHMDHVIGLPAWASQRQLNGMAGGRVYVPASLRDGVRELLATCARLEGGRPYDVEVIAVEPGRTVVLRRGFELRFVATSHWVETLGCCVEWVRRRLRPALAGLEPQELRRRHDEGEEITEEVRTLLLAYLADTGPEVFDADPTLAGAEVLVVECTFLRPMDRERAGRFGHMHLDDLVALAPTLRNRHLVLTHLSRRHRLGPGARVIRKALEGTLVPELHLLNVEWD
ncbi:MAG TPA: MBL fold metallo-hydrolase [Thermoanaerobaculaceae bacterium]|nr:MBL fold metallo-hydrolase [Thermoanaerobaculaceae bacterium]